MPLYEFEGRRPTISPSAFIHPQAVIIGDVQIGDNCYIAAGAVLRGDYGTIIIQTGSNIQDNCTVHAQPGMTAFLGERSHIGHGAIIHGPTFGKHVTVGMGAIVMDNSEIGDNAVIGAGALVTERMKIPANSMALGSPARVVKEISPDLAHYMNLATDVYIDLAKRSPAGLKLIED